MAHHASAKKRIRQIKKRTAINRMRVSRIRTSLRKIEAAIASGDKPKAMQVFSEVAPVLMAGANKGVVHRNKVARKMSRVSARIKSMAAAEA